MWELWRCRPLWNAQARQAFTGVVVNLALHIRQELYTGGLAMPVGSVGNKGRIEMVSPCFQIVLILTGEF